MSTIPEGGPSPDWLERNRKRMAEVDRLPSDLRALVHEFNWYLVKQYLDCGVRNARHIRHLIVASREGSASYSNGVSNFYCKECPNKKRPPSDSPGASWHAVPNGTPYPRP